MREGKTRVEAAAEMDVARTSFYDWAENHPEFSTALIKADQLCEAWWINKARDCLESTNFKTGVWAMVMGNKFHWTNQKTQNEHTGKGGGPIQTQQVPIDLSDLTEAELAVLEKLGIKINATSSTK